MTEQHSTETANRVKSTLAVPGLHPTTPAKAKTKKPHPDYPLFHHATGQWAKKVRGKLHYFGTESQEALERWLRDKDDLIAGRTPRAHGDEGLTVKQLCDLVMESREAKLDTGEMSKRHYDEMLSTAKIVAKQFGPNSLVEQLRPEDFRRLRSLLGKGVVLKSLEGRVARVRAIFNHASKNGLLEINVNKIWGTEFDKPSKSAIKKQDGDTEQLFSREEILKLLDQAGLQMKAMILIGINGGLGNGDVASIEKSDIANGWLTKMRSKTGKKRRTPLWKETLEAIQNALAKRPAAKDEDSEKVFITKYGNAWTPTGRDNPVSKEFAKVAKDSGITGKGKSFYTLRHTFQTIGDETKDFVAVSMLMGHVDSSISGHYREKISDERLKAIVDHVHDWLYPPTKKATRKSKGGAK